MLVTNIIAIFLLFASISFDFPSIGIDHVEGISFKSLQKTLKEKKKDLAKFKFDDRGVLTIFGSRGGITEPIVVDRKPLPVSCNRRPYYVFTFCPENEHTFKNNQKVCDEGITFCYESQLIPGRVREEFVLKSVADNPILTKCREFSGFKVAIKYMFAMFNDTLNILSKSYMLEVTTSFTEEPYYFPLPDSNCIDLYLGSAGDILAGVRTKENDDKLISPIKVRNHNGAYQGVHYDIKNETAKQEAFIADFTTFPDMEKMEYFSNNPHLKMLYMDFRARLFSPQTMVAHIPKHPAVCNMLVYVRGNLVDSCKSDWKQKNSALRAPNISHAVTEYAMTIESGSEDWKTSGRKSGSKKSSLQSTEKSSSTIDETSTLSGLQTEKEHISRDTSSHETSSTKGDSTMVGGEMEASGGATGQNYKAEAKAAAGGSFAQSSSTTDSYMKMEMRENMHRKSDTTITSTSTILEFVPTAYKETSTSIDTQEKQTFSSETVGVLKKTIFKWIVKVPPGKVVIPMQMQMDCDGSSVKIPWIRFDIKEEGEDLPASDYEGDDKLNLGKMEVKK